MTWFKPRFPEMKIVIYPRHADTPIRRTADAALPVGHWTRLRIKLRRGKRWTLDDFHVEH
jgi:hypothetical protein